MKIFSTEYQIILESDDDLTMSIVNYCNLKSISYNKNNNTIIFNFTDNDFESYGKFTLEQFNIIKESWKSYLRDD